MAWFLKLRVVIAAAIDEMSLGGCASDGRSTADIAPTVPAGPESLTPVAAATDAA